MLKILGNDPFVTIGAPQAHYFKKKGNRNKIILRQPENCSKTLFVLLHDWNVHFTGRRTLRVKCQKDLFLLKRNINLSDFTITTIQTH